MVNRKISTAQYANIHNHTNKAVLPNMSKLDKESMGSISSHEVSLDPRYGSPHGFINTGGDFFNYTLAALSVPKKSFLHYIDTKESRYFLNKFRRDMTKATKVYLGQQFIEIAVEVSLSYPKHIKNLMERMIPPTDNLWIEWNEEDRFNAFAKVAEKLGMKIANGDSVQKNDTGYLIRKSPAGGFEYSCVFPNVPPNGKDVLFFPALSWHFNNDLKEPYTTEAMNNLRTAQNMALVDSASDAANRTSVLEALWGVDYNAVHQEFDAKEHLSPWLFNLQMGIHDLGFCSYPELYSGDESAQYAQQADKIHLGDMRFLMAVFFLLNYPRIVKEGMPSPKRTKRLKWGKPLPRNEVKVVEIDLPKERGVNLVQKLFTGQGSPKRQHLRRRHPRRILDRKTGKLKYIKWIEPQLVGNPELGIIEHEYFLKSKGDKFYKPKGDEGGAP